MLPLALVLLLVVTVAVLSWRTRNKRLPVRCCNPAPWPPSDITARGAEPEATAARRAAGELD